MGKFKILAMGAVLAMAVSVTALAADVNGPYYGNSRDDRPGYGMMDGRDGYYHMGYGYRDSRTDRANRYLNEKEFNSSIPVNRDYQRDNYRRDNREEGYYCGYGPRRGYDGDNRGYNQRRGGYGPCY